MSPENEESRPRQEGGPIESDTDGLKDIADGGVGSKLSDFRQWVVWRFEDGDDGKPTKVPYNASDGTKASTNDSATWTSYDGAKRALDVFPDRWEGLGFVFTENDPFTGLDFDKCIKNGQIHPFVQSLIQRLDSYAEISVSGTGIHVIIKGKLDGNGIRTSKSPWGGGFEVYDQKRYFTMSGNHLAGTPNGINERQAQLDGIVAELVPPRPEAHATVAEGGQSKLKDDELLERARGADNGAKFKALFDDGDTRPYRDDESAADLALCSMLAFWSSGDVEQIDRLFRRSALVRAKWERADYREGTITKALAGRTEFYGASGSQSEVDESGEDDDAESDDTCDTGSPPFFSENGGGVEGESEGSNRRPSQATELAELARSRYQFHVTDHGEPFAVPLDGPHVARLLKGGQDSLRAELADLYCRRHDRVPSSQASTDALLSLEGRARNGEKVPLNLRVARHGEGLVLDLGDESGRVVVIEPSGWSLFERSPVLFRRSSLTRKLPVPQSGSLDELEGFLTVSSETSDLLIGWLVAALIPDLSHPIVAFTGEQGTGKSSAAAILGGVINPLSGELLTDQLQPPPRDIENWAVTASAAWVVALDNLSGVAPWFSDALCRAVTGGALSRRRLYTDSDLSVLSFRRVVVLNGIDLGAIRGDLADRLLLIELERIDDDHRRPESSMMEAWSRAHPLVLGALLDLTSRVLEELPRVKRDRPPEWPTSPRYWRR